MRISNVFSLICCEGLKATTAFKGTVHPRLPSFLVSVTSSGFLRTTVRFDNSLEGLTELTGSSDTHSYSLLQGYRLRSAEGEAHRVVSRRNATRAASTIPSPWRRDSFTLPASMCDATQRVSPDGEAHPSAGSEYVWGTIVRAQQTDWWPAHRVDLSLQMH